MKNWDLEIEKLKAYVFVDNLSYNEIGKLYNCSGTNIKKVMRKRGVKLPIRNEGNSKQIPHNKGKGKIYHCLNCGCVLTKHKNNKLKYCSNSCQREYEYKIWVEKYKQDNTIAINTKWGQIPSYLRRYIFEKFNNKCCLCNWSEVNPFTNTIPLEIDHIDGNSDNNSEENLRLICPNCHSLTSTYRGANRGRGRNITWRIKED